MDSLLGGCPKIPKGDLGTENVYIRDFQRFLPCNTNVRRAMDSCLEGASTANQRTESWGLLRRESMEFFISLFTNLKDNAIFDGCLLYKSILQFCFMGIVQHSRMFAKATSNFVKQIDSDGDLIPVSRLNDSDKIQPASLVIKKKRFWFWQKPRYIPLSFSLNEILHGEPTIIPVSCIRNLLVFTYPWGSEHRVSYCTVPLEQVQVCVNDGSNILKDSSVQLEIPPSTVVAYSVIELHIMVNGEYELCVLSDSWGGFETDSSSSGSLAWPSDQVMLVDASRLQCQTTAFQLSSADEKKLDQLSTGETPDLSELEELYSSQRESATALLRSLGLHYMDGKEMEPTEHCQECPDIVKASHMLISALKEMTEEALAELGNCYDIIPSLHLLVSHIIHNGKASLDEEPLTCLASEKTFLKAQSLFASSDINLQAADSTIKATAGQQPGHLPFLLCLVLDGLATLSARS
ncbi:GSDME protein, partial [Polypterus senegalus]